MPTTSPRSRTCARSSWRNPTSTLLVVTVTGAPYGMTSEWRRKQRYAILSGLHLAGFEPFDPEHIGFVEFEDAARDKALPAAVDSAVRSVLSPQRSAGQTENLMVAWFNEDVLWTDDPLRAAAQAVRAHRIRRESGEEWRRSHHQGAGSGVVGHSQADGARAAGGLPVPRKGYRAGQAARRHVPDEPGGVLRFVADRIGRKSRRGPTATVDLPGGQGRRGEGAAGAEAARRSRVPVPRHSVPSDYGHRREARHMPWPTSCNCAAPGSGSRMLGFGAVDDGESVPKRCAIASRGARLRMGYALRARVSADHARRAARRRSRRREDSRNGVLDRTSGGGSRACDGLSDPLLHAT